MPNFRDDYLSGGRHGEASVFDAFGGDESVAEGADARAIAAHDENFQAVVVLAAGIFAVDCARCQIWNWRLLGPQQSQRVERDEERGADIGNDAADQIIVAPQTQQNAQHKTAF